MGTNSFSRREGFGRAQPPIKHWHELPEDVRSKLLFVLLNEVDLRQEQVRHALCQEMQELEAGDEPEAQIKHLWWDAEWHLLFDLIERLARWKMEEDSEERPIRSWTKDGEVVEVPPRRMRARNFEQHVNAVLHSQGVGWELHEGRMVRRSGDDTQDQIVRSAIETLSSGGRRTAARELQEALMDISRRPNPDTTGCVTHAVAALETTARDVARSGETLGQLAQRNPDSLFPPPLHIAAEKLFGFASSHGRHLKEGVHPSIEEAELVLGAAAALTNYIARKNPLASAARVPSADRKEP